jgi:hypothetical protein
MQFSHALYGSQSNKRKHRNNHTKSHATRYICTRLSLSPIQKGEGELQRATCRLIEVGVGQCVYRHDLRD